MTSTRPAPKLSIVVSVYNHEGYIEECLRGIAMQEVDFDYEVYVGEDCSPDGTRDVLRRLEPELPDSFHILYREKNMGAVANGADLYDHCRGTYLASLEGDDYWTDPHKLQKQVDFLDANPDYVAVYSDCIVVDENSQPTGTRYPTCPDEDYSYREYFYFCMPGQTGTLVCRRQAYFDARNEFMRMRHFDSYMGDRRNAFLFLTMGKVRCMQEQMTAYRHVTSSGSSHSATVRVNEAYARNEVGFGRTLVDWARLHGTPEAVECAKLTYYRLSLKWTGRRGQKVLANDRRRVLSEIFHERRWPVYLTSNLRWYLVNGLRVLRGRPIDV